MVEREISNLSARVRFPVPAPDLKIKNRIIMALERIKKEDRQFGEELADKLFERRAQWMLDNTEIPLDQIRQMASDAANIEKHIVFYPNVVQILEQLLIEKINSISKSDL